MAKSAWVSGSVLIDTTSGFSSASAFSKLANFLAPCERLRQIALVDAALADADDFEAGNARVGERMAHAHVAEPDDQHLLSAMLYLLPFRLRRDHDPESTYLPVRADSSAASVASSAAIASSGRADRRLLPFSAQLAK